MQGFRIKINHNETINLINKNTDFLIFIYGNTPCTLQHLYGMMKLHKKFTDGYLIDEKLKEFEKQIDTKTPLAQKILNKIKDCPDT